MIRTTQTWVLDADEVAALTIAIKPVLARFGADATGSRLSITRTRPNGTGPVRTTVTAHERDVATDHDEPLNQTERAAMEEIVRLVRHIAPALRAIDNPACVSGDIAAMIARCSAWANAADAAASRLEGLT